MARGLQVNLTVNENTKALLNKLVNVVGKDILDDVASVILNRNKARFLLGVTPDNVRWPESESARRRKAGLPDSQGIRRVGSTGNTLFSTSSLFESIQILTSRSTKNQRVVSVNPAFSNRKTGGRVIDYAVQHQFGRGGQLKRQFLGVNNQDANVVDVVIQRALERINK